MELIIPEVVKLVVKIGGNSYDCRPVLVKDLKKIRGIQASLTSDNPDAQNEGFDAMVDLISDHGIPKQVLENLSTQSFNSLVEYLVGSEKK